MQVRDGAFLWATMLFIILSCAAFGAGRSGDGSVASDSRYRDFPVFATALAYCVILLGLPPARKQIWLVLTTIAGLFFCLSSYAVYTPRLLDQNARHIAGAYNWHHNRDWLIYRETSYFSQVANGVSRELEDKATDWYHIPDYFIDPPTLSTVKMPAPAHLDSEVVSWWSPVDPIGSNQPYYWLQSGLKVYLLPLKRPTSLVNWLRTGRSLGHSFIPTFYYSRVLLPGQYTASVYLTPANQRLVGTPGLSLTVGSSHPCWAA